MSARREKPKKKKGDGKSIGNGKRDIRSGHHTGRYSCDKFDQREKTNCTQSRRSSEETLVRSLSQNVLFQQRYTDKESGTFQDKGKDGIGNRSVPDRKREQESIKELEKAGIDLIDVSAGIYESVIWIAQPSAFSRGCLVELGEKIKPNKANLFVLCTGCCVLRSGFVIPVKTGINGC